MDQVTTVFDQIGGQASVDAAVEMFYDKVLQDDRINGFFTGTNMDGQKLKMKRFLARLLAGQSEGAEDYMRASHRHLVDQGLNESHFAAVAGHLQATLEGLSVPQALVAQIMTVAAGLQDAVLNR